MNSKNKILELLTEEEKKILFWDYIPEKLEKKQILKRIAEFFPSHGRNPFIIKELYKEIGNLKLDKSTKSIIKLYYEVLTDMEKNV